MRDAELQTKQTKYRVACILRMSPHRALFTGLVWTGTQALWLAEAYNKLEFLGDDVFIGLGCAASAILWDTCGCWVAS